MLNPLLEELSKFEKKNIYIYFYGSHTRKLRGIVVLQLLISRGSALFKEKYPFFPSMWLSPFFSSFDHNLYSLIARINHGPSREISIGGPISRGQVAARDISARFVLASRRRRAVRFPAGGNAIHGDTWSCKSYRVNCRVLGPVRAHFASILNANRPSLPAARAPPRPRLAVISFDDENSIYVCLGHRNASALVRYDGESSQERGFSFFFV